MDHSADPATSAVVRTLDQELTLLREAIAIVAARRRAARGRRRAALRRGPPRAGLGARRGRRRAARPVVDARRRRAPTSPWSGSTMTEPDARLLIVEDDESLRLIVARHLRSLGYRVAEAASAEARGRGARRRPASRRRDPRPEPAGRHRLGPAPRPGAGRRRPRRPWSSRAPPRSARSGSTSSACAGYLPKPFPLDTLVATIERLTHPEEPQQQP